MPNTIGAVRRELMHIVRSVERMDIICALPLMRMFTWTSSLLESGKSVSLPKQLEGYWENSKKSCRRGSNTVCCAYQ